MFRLKHSFASLLCLIIQLQKDQLEPEQVLRLRDQKVIGQTKSFTSEKITNIEKIILWLKEINPNQFHGLQKLEFLFYFFVVSSGFICGVLMAAAVFYYNGQQPINIIGPIFVYALLPIIFFIFNLLFFLPSRLSRRIPLLNNMMYGISVFNLSKSLLNLLGKSFTDLSSIMSPLKNNSLTSVNKWFFLKASQCFSCCFFLGSIIYFFFLLVFSDLAFGWSSTLNLSSNTAYQIVDTLSLPWKTYYPDATGSLELVKETRFFRLDNILNNHISPNEFGAWWDFLLLLMLVYGLMPRLFLFLISQIIFNRKLKKTHLSNPGINQLLWRLDAFFPTIECDGQKDTSNVDRGDRSISKKTLPIVLTSLELPDRTVFVAWAFELKQAQLKTLSTIKDCHSANIVNAYTSLNFDVQKCFTFIKEQNPIAICIFVKAWEAPTEDIFDFINELLGDINPSVKIFLVPINPSSKDMLSPGLPRNEQIWARKVKSLENSPVIIRSLSEQV